MSIFQSAVKQLTLWYVSALFLVCLVFSVPTYVIASNRLEGGARKQAAIVEELGPTGVLVPKAKLLRDQQISQDRQQLLRTIVVANLAILSLGAYFSYRFAKRTLKPIEDAHEAQARFTTDASHELRTPLATMQAEIEVALRDKQLDTKQAKYVLGSNLEELARLRNLSEQLLNLTRLDSGQLQKTKVPFSKLVRDELSVLAKRHPQATIEPVIGKNVSIFGDKHLLRQLITILTDNAIKYAGDKPPRLQVALTSQDGGAKLTFTDHGIGIKATELPHVFDRFYRGTNAAKHSTNGHGLGLSLAKQIVQAHGGTIKATSSVGTFTTFELTFPS